MLHLLRRQPVLPGRDSPIDVPPKDGIVTSCLDLVALEAGKKGNYRAITPYKPHGMRFLAIFYGILTGA